MKTKAAVLYEMGKPQPYATSRPLVIEDIELAGPQWGEVLVQVMAAGICHSDLSVINGDRPRPLPMVLGHEAAGIVRELGPGEHTVQEGDSIVFSYVPSCGHCAMCIDGRAALCEKGAKSNGAGTLLSGGRRFTNSKKTPLNHHLGVSAFSEFTVTASESLVRIDKNLPLKKAALFGCAVSTGVGAITNTAHIEHGASVAIFGLGGVGLSAILGARAVGAHPIIAVDVLESKLELAKKIGATLTINAKSEDVVKQIRDFTDGGANYVLECVGSSAVLAQAYAATRRGGTTVVVGLAAPSQTWPISPLSIVAEERTIKGSYMGSCVPRRDVPRLIAMHQAGLLPVESLHSHTVKLEQINEAMDALAAGSTVRQIIELNS